MTELILISAATAFLLAVVEPVVAFLAIFISGKVSNAIFALGFSSLATWLSGVTDVKTFVLLVLAASFVGPATLEIVEYTATHKAVRTRVSD